MRLTRAALAVLLLCPAPAAWSAADVRPLFRQGSAELRVGGGYGAFDDRDYAVLLLGGAYYLRDGLSVGLETEAWTGSSPQIYGVSPQARYVFLDSDWGYKPYAGVFYRRTAYARRFRPLDTAGVRGGLIFPLSRRAYLTAGVAYEDSFSCDKGVYSRCDGLSPELGLTFGF